MKKAVIRVSSLVLAVIIMLCPLSFCFATEVAAADYAGSLIIDLLWETLKSWGIQIINNEIQEINDNVRQWLSGGLFEYLANELQETFDYWITGMEWYRDQFGRLVGNDNYVQKANWFAEWLIENYNLTNDSTTELDIVYVYNGIELHEFPIYCWGSGRYYDSNIQQNVVYTGETLIKLNNDYTGIYGIFGEPNNYGDSLFFVSKTRRNSMTSNVYTPDNITLGGVLTGSLTQKYLTIGGVQYPTGDWYTYKATSNNPDSSGGRAWYLSGDHYSSMEVANALNQTGTLTPSGIYAETTTIETPENDPSYEPGYSIIYYPDGSTAYLDIDWPTTISADNLPAIVSTGSIPNPGFADVFLPLRAFVNTFSEGMAIVKDVVFHLPTEAQAIFYAIMSITVIFGALHMFKEH